MLYFDNSATTRMDKRVIEAMNPFLEGEYGNPDGKYYELAVNAKLAVNDARETIADFLKCNSDEVIFTSGATESNNLILKGLVDYNNIENQHFVTTNIEHASTLETIKYLGTIGLQTTFVEVDCHGLIKIDKLDEVLKTGVEIFAFSLVNSEIGTIQNLQKINEVCSTYKVPILLDITQGLSKIRIDLSELDMVNYVSFSSHKIHGPKGIGCAIIRKDHDGIKRNITPLIHGGSQEFKYRAGTTATHLIVGFSKAIEILDNEFNNNSMKLSSLDDLFVSLAKEIDGIQINNDFESRVKGIISLRFKGFNNQILLKRAKDVFAASTGSACSNTKPSYVLREIGLSTDEIQESIRFSLSKFNTLEEVRELFNNFK